MAVDTTQTVKVEITYETAQALWAAMHEDDGLASDYADLCIIHGLNHLIAQVDTRHWSQRALAKVLDNLGQAKAQAVLREEDVVNRFVAYGEPPF